MMQDKMTVDSPVWNGNYVAPVFVNEKTGKHFAIFGCGYLPEDGEDEFSEIFVKTTDNITNWLRTFGYDRTNIMHKYSSGDVANFRPNKEIPPYGGVVPFFTMDLNDNT